MNRSKRLTLLLFLFDFSSSVQSWISLPAATTKTKKKVSSFGLHQSSSTDTFPAPVVWELESTFPTDSISISSRTWSRVVSPESSQPAAALETWNWCRHFVLGLQLCPWAKASLETSNATQIFVVNNDDDNNEKTKLVQAVAHRFTEFIDANNSSSLESAAIFFVLFVNKNDNNDDSFLDFYDWFVEMEEDWELDDDVIVAPFHPDWEFEGDESQLLKFEKKSPYPTVSLVSARVVESAGPSVTEQIGVRNEELLRSKTPNQLQELWNSSIIMYTNADNDNDDTI